MPIKEKNLEILDGMTKGISGVAVRIARDSFEYSVDSMREFQHLRNNVLTLSAGIASVVIPLILNKTALVHIEYFLASLLFFGLNVLFGILTLAIDLSGEPKVVEKNSDAQLTLVEHVRQGILRIKTIDDNDTAGRELIKLRQEYTSLIEGMKKDSNFWGKYKDAIFYGLFTVSFCLLVIGVVLNAY